MASESIEERINELRRILLKPEVIAEQLKPYIDEMLTAQMDNTRRRITETVAPVLGEAVRRVEHKADEQNRLTQEQTKTIVNEALNRVETLGTQQKDMTEKLGSLLQRLVAEEQAQRAITNQLEETRTQVKQLSDRQETMSTTLAVAPPPPLSPINMVEERRELMQSIYPAIHQLVDDAVYQATEKLEASIAREQAATRAAEERSAWWFKLLTFIIIALLITLILLSCLWATSVANTLNSLTGAATATAEAMAQAPTETLTAETAVTPSEPLHSVEGVTGGQSAAADANGSNGTGDAADANGSNGTGDAADANGSNGTGDATADANGSNGTGDANATEFQAENGAVITDSSTMNSTESTANTQADVTAVSIADTQLSTVTSLPTGQMEITHSITGTVIAAIMPLDSPNGEAINLTLPTDTTVTVFGAEEAWYQLSFLLPETGGEHVGWVPAEYVQLQGPLPTALLPTTGER